MNPGGVSVTPAQASLPASHTHAHLTLRSSSLINEETEAQRT